METAWTMSEPVELSAGPEAAADAARQARLRLHQRMGIFWALGGAALMFASLVLLLHYPFKVPMLHRILLLSGFVLAASISAWVAWKRKSAGLGASAKDPQLSPAWNTALGPCNTESEQ